jgi:phytoene/squalene synthetase
MSAAASKMGRPPRLSHADEFELYCYRKSGVAIKTCASMWRVSVPTANRIIAKFRAYDARVEPLAREFRDMIDSLEDSTLS